MKKKQGKKRLVQTARLAGLPEEVLFGAPKVVLVGEERALVENHKGIVEYTDERVRVRTDRALLEIAGANLTLGHVGKSDLLVRGKIEKVEYKFKRGGGNETREI